MEQLFVKMANSAGIALAISLALNVALAKALCRVWSDYTALQQRSAAAIAELTVAALKLAGKPS